jgi:uncharacterized protein
VFDTDLEMPGSHTGDPWVDEMLTVATNWPDVWVNISAWLSKHFGSSLLRFLRGPTGHRKVLFGANRLDWPAEPSLTAPGAPWPAAHRPHPTP